LLDNYAENTYKDLLDKYVVTYDKYKAKKKELEDLESADQALLQRLDLLKFQYEELQEANLLEDEVTQLEIDIKRIKNSESLSLDLNIEQFTLMNKMELKDVCIN